MNQQQQSQGTAAVVTLNTLNPGQSGRIVRVNGQATDRRRLLEMGLVRGEWITVERG